MMPEARLEVHSCPELMELIGRVGFLPLLESGIPGYCAEGMMAEECRFVRFADGSWEWPLWQWKSALVTEGDCVYGKFFAGKAGFICRSWWPHFFQWRRSKHPAPEPGTIEDTILTILNHHGSMIARELRRSGGKDIRSEIRAKSSSLELCLMSKNRAEPQSHHTATGLRLVSLSLFAPVAAHAHYLPFEDREVFVAALLTRCLSPHPQPPISMCRSFRCAAPLRLRPSRSIGARKCNPAVLGSLLTAFARAHTLSPLQVGYRLASPRRHPIAATAKANAQQVVGQRLWLTCTHSCASIACSRPLSPGNGSGLLKRC